MSSHLATRLPLSRRTFLRGTGVSLALPFLDLMTPFRARGAAAPKPPGRFVAICAPLGFHTPFLHPKDTGPAYTPTPYLEPLRDFRA
ncbi:MAG: hypothetical protein AB7O66_24540, partial [Limisphaerales bacterium]